MCQLKCYFDPSQQLECDRPGGPPPYVRQCGEAIVNPGPCAWDRKRERFREYAEEDMPIEIRDFWRKHAELLLIGVVRHPSAWPVYNFLASDGVRVNVSVDYGGYRHISFTKRQPPFFKPDTTGMASQEEMDRYLDDFSRDTDFIRKPSPFRTAVIHFYQVGHPEAN